MSKKHEAEQAKLDKRVKILKTELRKEKSQRLTADVFLEIVRRYTDAQKVTGRVVRELIDHIDV